jgi:hypothetical protein
MKLGTSNMFTLILGVILSVNFGNATSTTIEFRFPNTTFDNCCNTTDKKKEYLIGCNKIFDEQDSIKCLNVTEFEGSAIVTTKSKNPNHESILKKKYIAAKHVNNHSTENGYVYNTTEENASEKVAVIFSGEEFYYDGKRIRESLIAKDYDVHLTEAHVAEERRPNYFDIHDWNKTPLMKNLNEKNHYNQLLFLVTAHGHNHFGANIMWSSLLKLVKILESKADEIYIHLDTCHSGDAAKVWEPKLGNNVKVLTAASCDGKTTAYSPQYTEWNLVNQIFTGYYLDLHGIERITNAGTDEFLSLFNCESTVGDIQKLFQSECQATKCTKLHVIRGEEEQLNKWNILPINLAVVSNSNPIKQIQFRNYQTCGVEKPKAFDVTQIVDFNPPQKLDTELVNTKDPVETWKLRVDDIPVKTDNGRVFNPIPESITNKNLEPYSTILMLNDVQCKETDRQCRNRADRELPIISKLKLGYYNTRKIWILDDDKPYQDKEMDEWTKIIIGVSCVVGVLIIAIIIYFCCCNKKKPKKHQKSAAHHRRNRQYRI